jgi:hypothetical protein
MEWSDVPKNIGGEVGISVWQDVIEDRIKTADASIPANKPKESNIKGVTVIWQQQRDDPGKIVEFSQKVSFPSRTLRLF